LDAFAVANGGQLPRPRNDEDAAKVLKLAQEINEKMPDATKVEKLDESLVQELAFQSRGDITPMAAVIGGLVAQEVLKACSGKFNPIHQFFFFDSLESLPTSVTLTEADCAPVGSRYDGQIAVFGSQFQKVINESNHFLVGAGAMFVLLV
jgi:ubiquitin-activating enzyme E1